MKPIPRTPSRQRGSVLIISLIMLMVLTLLAISAINMSTTGLRIVNSMQARGESMSAAQRCVEQVISSNFADTIGSIAGTCTVAVNSSSYDVVLAAPCLKQMTSVRNTELKLTDAEDLKCYDTTTNPFSACANTVWEFSGIVNQGFFGVNTSLKQGISLRMDNSSAIAYSTSTSPNYACP